MGITIVPRQIATSYAKQPITPIRYARWDSRIQVVWQKAANLSPVTQNFINLLKQGFKQKATRSYRACGFILLGKIMKVKLR